MHAGSGSSPRTEYACPPPSIPDQTPSVLLNSSSKSPNSTLKLNVLPTKCSVERNVCALQATTGIVLVPVRKSRIVLSTVYLLMVPVFVSMDMLWLQVQAASSYALRIVSTMELVSVSVSVVTIEPVVELVLQGSPVLPTVRGTVQGNVFAWLGTPCMGIAVLVALKGKSGYLRRIVVWSLVEWMRYWIAVITVFAGMGTVNMSQNVSYVLLGSSSIMGSVHPAPRTPNTTQKLRHVSAWRARWEVPQDFVNLSVRILVRSIILKHRPAVVAMVWVYLMVTVLFVLWELMKQLASANLPVQLINSYKVISVFVLLGMVMMLMVTVLIVVLFQVGST